MDGLSVIIYLPFEILFTFSYSFTFSKYCRESHVICQQFGIAVFANVIVLSSNLSVTTQTLEQIWLIRFGL